MATVGCILGHTQNLINRAIELVRESEELVPFTTALQKVASQPEGENADSERYEDSLKSPARSCVSTTLPAYIVNANHGVK